jgi:hypothetical protein
MTKKKGKHPTLRLATVHGRATVDLTAVLAERVRGVIASRDEPPEYRDLRRLCPFAGEAYLQSAIEYLVDAGLVSVGLERIPGTRRMKAVYRPVPIYGRKSP